MERKCGIFVVKRLHFKNILDFNWTWTLHFENILDCDWTWTGNQGWFWIVKFDSPLISVSRFR